MDRQKHADKLFNYHTVQRIYKKSSDSSLTFIQLLIGWTVLIDRQTFRSTDILMLYIGWTINQMNRISDGRRSPNIASRLLYKLVSICSEYFLKLVQSLIKQWNTIRIIWVAFNKW